MNIGSNSRADGTSQYDVATTPLAYQLQSRVCVWLDAHLIAEWTGPSSKAERYAALLSSQFPNLRLTREPTISPAVIH